MECERNPGMPEHLPDFTAFHPGYKIAVDNDRWWLDVARMECERNPGIPKTTPDFTAFHPGYKIAVDNDRWWLARILHEHC